MPMSGTRILEAPPCENWLTPPPEIAISSSVESVGALANCSAAAVYSSPWHFARAASPAALAFRIADMAFSTSGPVRMPRKAGRDWYLLYALSHFLYCFS